jgi:hypothetical protein
MAGMKRYPATSHLGRPDSEIITADGIRGKNKGAFIDTGDPEF